MINIQKEKWFKGAPIFATGAVTNLKNLKTNKGKAYTTFSLLYGKTESEKFYINCQVWDNQNMNLSSDYANRLERGDNVLCAGRLIEDTYWTEKKGETQYVFVVEWISAQPLFDDGEDADDVDLSDI